MLLAFLAVMMAVFGVYSLLTDLFLRDRSQISERLDEEFLQRKRELARKAVLFRDLQQLQLEVSEAQPGLKTRLRAIVEQSGLEISLERLLIISGIMGVVPGV